MKNKKKIKRIYVSPSHFIGTSIMLTNWILFSLGILVWYVLMPDPVLWVMLFCIQVMCFAPLAVTMPKSYRGVTCVWLNEAYLETRYFITKKVFLRLNWDEVRYIAFTRSINYSFDFAPIYVVLSKEPIIGREFALTYDVKKQIVLRVDKKACKQKFQWLLNTGIDEDFLMEYDRMIDLMEKMPKRRICFAKNDEGEWKHMCLCDDE